MLLKKQSASKPPSLIIKLKHERFITAKNQVETINKNNNVAIDPKKDDNENFEQHKDFQTKLIQCKLVSTRLLNNIIIIKKNKSKYD